MLLSQFIALESKFGKLIVFDEAHKYMVPNSKDELTLTITSTGMLLTERIALHWGFFFFFFLTR